MMFAATNAAAAVSISRTPEPQGDVEPPVPLVPRPLVPRQAARCQAGRSFPGSLPGNALLTRLCLSSTHLSPTCRPVHGCQVSFHRSYRRSTQTGGSCGGVNAGGWSLLYSAFPGKEPGNECTRVHTSAHECTRVRVNMLRPTIGDHEADADQNGCGGSDQASAQRFA